MAKRKNIDDELILQAKAWLNDGGTKKGACEILGVSNNKTMESQIEEFNNRIRIDREVRARRRKEAVSGTELVGMITAYLSGDTLEDLRNSYYRSVDTIKYHLEKAGALFRETRKIDPLAPPMFPDQAVTDNHAIGDYVWVAKYGSIGKVCSEYSNAFRVRVWGDGIMQYTYQPAYELGSLKHLENLGVDTSKLTGATLTNEEIMMQINKTLVEANKRTRKSKED